MGCTAPEIRCHSTAVKYAPATDRNHSTTNPFLSHCRNIKEHARHLNYGVMTIRFCFVAGDNSQAVRSSHHVNPLCRAVTKQKQNGSAPI
jgi:pyridoxal biosynthesis lyase PdxS